VPEPASVYDPPAITRRMLVGAQPPVSWYRTEKWNEVAVVPLPGEAVPEDSVRLWEAPLQLAATTV
jgi:hypothetical protein